MTTDPTDPPISRQLDEQDAARDARKPLPPDATQETQSTEQTPKGPHCRLCGKRLQDIGGYLVRVNEKGVHGIWECRPTCDADLPQETNVLLAINDEKESPMTDIRGAICTIISDMLDGPTDHGIYQTTKCFDALETFIKGELASATAALAEAERERDGARSLYNNEARLIACIWDALGLETLDEVAHTDETLDTVIAKLKQRAKFLETELAKVRNAFTATDDALAIMTGFREESDAENAKLTAERDALALALVEWQGKAAAMFHALRGFPIGHADTYFATLDMVEKNIRALDPPSRERGEELLRVLEEARKDAEIVASAKHYVACAAGHLSQFVRENSRHGKTSPWGELCEAIDAAIKEGRG